MYKPTGGLTDEAQAELRVLKALADARNREYAKEVILKAKTGDEILNVLKGHRFFNHKECRQSAMEEICKAKTGDEILHVLESEPFINHEECTKETGYNKPYGGGGH